MTVGGIIRSEKGEWIVGNTKFIGCGNLFLVKAWSLFIGLQIEINLGTSKLEAETKSQIFFNLMSNPISDQHTIFIIISNCRLLTSRFEEYQIAEDQQKTKLLHRHFSKESKNKCKPHKDLCRPTTFCSNGVSQRSWQYLVMLYCSASLLKS